MKASPGTSTHPLQCTARLGAAIATALGLAACAGGGGTHHATLGGGSPPPPAPATVTSTTRCQSGSADCVLAGNDGLIGNRTSSGRLGKSDGGLSELYAGTFSFRGGTTVDGGTLFIYPNATLVSDATVGVSGKVFVFGLLRGDVSNAGSVYGNQYCDDETTGACASAPPPGIDGNYQQSASGALRLTLGMPLHVTGHASLAGSVELVAPRVDHWSGYVLPGAGTRQFILHADGGVSGQFSQWASRSSWGDAPAIFLEGSLGYGPTDAWFDVVRSSLQATMSSAGSARAVVESGGVLDRAFALTDAWATQDPTTLTQAQLRMLASAASIQHIDSLGQAGVSLPSLAGAGQADAVERLVAEAQANGGAADARLDGMEPGRGAGDWFAAGGTEAGFGHDRWLGGRWLLGSSMATSAPTSSLAQSRPSAGVYLRRYGAGDWYAGASLTHSAGDFLFDRAIDLGPAGRAVAMSQRQVAITNLRVQAGRSIDVPGGRLTAFASLDTSTLRSGESVEPGNTGFELHTAASRRNFVNGDAGLRYARQWNFASARWELDLAAGYRTATLNSPSPLQANYVGLPGLHFDVPDPDEPGGAWTSLGVRGRERQGWSWAFDRRGPSHAQGNAARWLLRIERAF